MFYVFQGHLHLEMDNNNEGSKQKLSLKEVTNVNINAIHVTLLFFCLRLRIVASGFLLLFFVPPEGVAKDSELTRRGSFQLSLLLAVNIKTITVKKLYKQWSDTL